MDLELYIVPVQQSLYTTKCQIYPHNKIRFREYLLSLTHMYIHTHRGKSPHM